MILENCRTKEITKPIAESTFMLKSIEESRGFRMRDIMGCEPNGTALLVIIAEGRDLGSESLMK
jgi:hypothetical protein